MKINLSILLFWGVALLILSTQGILMFNIFKLVGMWELKSAVQPTGVLLVFSYFFLSKVPNQLKITQVDFVLFGYFMLTFIVLLFNAEGPGSIYIAIREVFLLFFLIFVFNQMALSKSQWNWILTMVFILVLANIFFTLLIFVIGLERYMVLLTGEFFWGNHPIYKFKISNFVGTKLYRVPALVGEAATLGHFGIFSYFLLRSHKKFKNWAFLSLILVALCFIRSVYVLLILYWLFWGISTNKKFAKFALYSLPLLPIGAFVMTKYNLFDLKSLFMRFDFWQTKISVDYNFLFGGAIGRVGKATTSGGFEDTIDNYWLFLLFSIGITGIVLAILFLYEKSRNNKELLIITLATCIAGLFITLTQSMVILVMLPLMFMNFKNLMNRNQTK